MSRVISYSRKFPSYHERKGEPTYFVEKFLRSVYYGKTPLLLDHLEGLNPDYAEISDFRAELRHPMDFEPKHHTIRNGNRWKAGMKFSPRVWSGTPYKSKMIIIAPDTEIKLVQDFKIRGGLFFIDNKKVVDESILHKLANNDGLTRSDLFKWFKYPKDFTGQIICWADNIKY